MFFEKDIFPSGAKKTNKKQRTEGKKRKKKKKSSLENLSNQLKALLRANRSFWRFFIQQADTVKNFPAPLMATQISASIVSTSFQRQYLVIIWLIKEVYVDRMLGK